MLRLLIALSMLLLPPSAAALAQDPAGGASPPPLPEGEAPPADAVAYYVAEADGPAGPLSLAELLEQIEAGEIGPLSFVWKVGTEAWDDARSFPELAAALAGYEPPEIPGEAAARRLLTGVWQFIAALEETGQVETLQLRFEPDGSYRGIRVLQDSPEAEPVVADIDGTWTVTSLDGARFALTLSDDGTGNERSSVLRIANSNMLINEMAGTQAYRLGR